MKIGDDEYKKLLDAYMVEQFKLTKPKPNGMMGHWGWYAVKKREFNEMMIREGKVSEDIQPHTKPA